MEVAKLKPVVEGLLFASGEDGITAKHLSKIMEIPEWQVVHLIDELKDDYGAGDRGIMVIQSHEVYHLTTKPEHSSYYKKMMETPKTTRMSQAALETLAIVAYQQPITRTEIEEIRGVKSDRPVKTLLARSLIEESGRKESVGRPVLFSTTKEFLTYFGLTSLEELPPLPEDADDFDQEADIFFEKFDE
ncbi:SMC-Scp complex subunit ScpB [Virgibacillus xinjiangensis]|uniref:Segregation and condensation protein B n=1 Tax=Virgibacillus xinjiangensis TaxID=393090 RepID=A0ABV7CRP2_9BACI